MSEIVESILHNIKMLCQKRKHLLIAIDGRCAAGKTTLAAHLQEACGCNVIPMDHFFLRPEQRSAERLNEPGGNVDYERFLEEVLFPIKHNKPSSYRPYDCQKQELEDAMPVKPHYINIIEGSYCCHPKFLKYYDLRVFLTVDAVEQMCRIKHRNGDIAAVQFQEKCIPLEERYFLTFDIEESCDLCFNTDS